LPGLIGIALDNLLLMQKEKGDDQKAHHDSSSNLSCGDGHVSSVLKQGGTNENTINGNYGSSDLSARPFSPGVVSA